MVRNSIALTFLLLTLTLTAAPAEAQGGLRFTVMVSKFENEVPRWRDQWDLGDSWRTTMTAALGENEKFIVVGVLAPLTGNTRGQFGHADVDRTAAVLSNGRYQPRQRDLALTGGKNEDPIHRFRHTSAY